MADLRVISTSAGKDRAVHDTDVGLLGAVATASGSGQSFKIYGESGNLAFTMSPNGNISFNNIVITNIVFDNTTHEITASTQTATNNGAGIILLSGAGGIASGTTPGGIGGTTVIISGTGGAAQTGATGAGGAGGDLNITAASGGPGSDQGAGGVGGNLSIFAGNAGTNNGGGGANGGNFVIDAGVATGAGTNGTMSIGSSIASAMSIANGTIPVTANGDWTFTNLIVGTISNADNVLSTTVYTCPSGVAVTNLVYINGSGSVDFANATSNYPAIGFVVSKPTSTTCIVKWVGEVAGFSSLTPGSVYYLDTANGGINATAPGSGATQRVGVAINATTLYVGLSHDFVVI